MAKMDNDTSSAIRDLVAEEAPPSPDDSGGIKPPTVLDEEPKGVRGLMADRPSNRIIYLDEQAMRSISCRLVNDSRQFSTLSGMRANDHVRLEVINDANDIDPVYFALRIWHVPPSETVIDIPPLDASDRPYELYPGAIVRVRAFLNAKDLRPDRLTLTCGGNVRVHAELENRGVLSINRTFLNNRALYVVGQLRRLTPLVLTTAAILLSEPR